MSDEKDRDIMKVEDYDIISSCVSNAYLSGAPLEQIMETFLMCDDSEQFLAAMDALVEIANICSEHYERSA